MKGLVRLNNIKPDVVSKKSIDDVRLLISEYNSSCIYNKVIYHKKCFRVNGDNTVYFWNIEKFNAKYHQEKYKTGPKKGQTKKSIKIRDKEFIVRIYSFPLEIIKYMIDDGYVFEQKQNYFKIYKK